MIYWQLLGVYLKIGIFGFGGGYAMLPILQAEVVEKYHWATEEELADYYAVGQCTPGVIAVNTATFIGMKRRAHRNTWRGLPFPGDHHTHCRFPFQFCADPIRQRCLRRDQGLRLCADFQRHQETGQGSPGGQADHPAVPGGHGDQPVFQSFSGLAGGPFRDCGAGREKSRR